MRKMHTGFVGNTTQSPEFVINAMKVKGEIVGNQAFDAMVAKGSKEGVQDRCDGLAEGVVLFRQERLGDAVHSDSRLWDGETVGTYEDVTAIQKRPISVTYLPRQLKQSTSISPRSVGGVFALSIWVFWGNPRGLCVKNARDRCVGRHRRRVFQR